MWKLLLTCLSFTDLQCLWSNSTVWGWKWWRAWGKTLTNEAQKKALKCWYYFQCPTTNSVTVKSIMTGVENQPKLDNQISRNRLVSSVSSDLQSAIYRL